MKKKSLWIIGIAILMASTNALGADILQLQPIPVMQMAKLSGGEDNQLFGYSIAISGNTLAVGDPYDSQYGNQAGSVTVFQLDISGHWKEVSRVTPEDAEAGIAFGRNIALSGDRLVVGAPYDNDFGERSGSIYIFERNQGGLDAWGQVIKLTASDAYTYDQYGWAVAVDGDTVASGAYTKTYGGRVYIYERDAGGPGAWGETAQLNPDPPGFQACFGEALDIDDDLIAVGAYGGGDYSGYAYIFQRQAENGQWQRQAAFRAADTDGYHYFGYSIALDNWTLLAGAPGADGLTGAAYIFTAEQANPTTWTERARLAADDAVMGDFFGIQLDLSGNFAWIGAPLHDEDTGSVYLFRREQDGSEQWHEVTSVVGEDTTQGDQFGSWTAIDGKLAAAGAPGDLPNGSVYIFKLYPTWKMHFPFVIH